MDTAASAAATPGTAHHRVAAALPPAPDRALTVGWDDLAPLLARAMRDRGLDVLRGIAAGALPAPPVHHLLGIEHVLVEEGRVAFTLAPHAAHGNPTGAVHGGVLATLLDSAMACAVYTTLPAGTGYTTLDLHVRYLRPAGEASGLLRAEGTVVHTGAKTAVAEGRVTDARGRLVAHATEGCLVLPGWGADDRAPSGRGPTAGLSAAELPAAGSQ